MSVRQRSAPCVYRRLILHCVALLSLAAGLSFSCFGQDQGAARSAVPPMNGIAHVAIRVKDVSASVAFYHKLGFDQAFASTAKEGATVTQSFIKINDHQYIELYPVSTQDNAQSGSAFLHLCFEGADLKALHDYYVSQGLAPTSVSTGEAGNLLFSLKGPQQSAEPQTIEYTQYMPGSKHALAVGKLLGPDRVGEKISVVALAMQDASAARDFYVTKLGFTPNKANPTRLDLPGTSGEQVEIVPAEMLGGRSSILLESANLDKAAAQLTRQQIEFKRASASQTGGDGKAHTIDMISITDPDSNIIRLQSVH